MKTPEQFAKELFRNWVLGTTLEDEMPDWMIDSFYECAEELFKEAIYEGQNGKQIIMKEVQDKIDKLINLAIIQYNLSGPHMDFAITCRHQGAGARFCFSIVNIITGEVLMNCWGIDLKDCIGNSFCILEGKQFIK